jgi:hypothetical protein
MVHRPGSLLIPGFLVAVSGFAQIGFPGQYPGGQYPGGQYPGGQYPGQGRYPQSGSSIPLPGRSKTTTTSQDNQAPLTTFNGVLRRVSETDLVVESEDKRIVTISIEGNTRFYKASGGGGKLKDFQPGDHLSVDATQDDNASYHATRVTQIKQGTPQERAAASEPVDTSPIAPDGSSGGDDDRPRLHRTANPDDASNTQSVSSTRSPSTSSANSQSSAPIPPAPDDPGPPTLKRGSARPATSSDTSNSQIASNQAPASSSSSSSSPSSPSSVQRPSIQAQEVNGVTRAPQAPSTDTSEPVTSQYGNGGISMPKSGDPVIDQARDAAFSFSETLPNYVVKQFTTRFQTEAAHGGQTSWRAIDNVTADVVSENGKDSYKNILINGRVPKEAVEKTGSWSTGEYSSVLQDVLQPQTDADFHNKRSTTIVNRAAFRYDFSVEQPNSHWHVYAGAESYKPEYTGSIWVDKENFRVLRIELSARNMPRGFPLDTVESAVDYDYVMIGGTKYLLPVHSEALSCERGTSVCSRNVIDFRNYKKFGADTSITFDPTP